MRVRLTDQVTETRDTTTNVVVRDAARLKYDNGEVINRTATRLTTIQTCDIISSFDDMNKSRASVASQDLLDFTKAIGSESRIQILLLFLDGQERTVNQITEAVGLGQPTTSEHLAIMKRSKILTAEKRGKEVYYQPDRIQIAHYLDVISNILKKCC